MSTKGGRPGEETVRRENEKSLSPFCENKDTDTCGRQAGLSKGKHGDTKRERQAPAQNGKTLTIQEKKGREMKDKNPFMPRQGLPPGHFSEGA